MCDIQCSINDNSSEASLGKPILDRIDYFDQISGPDKIITISANWA